MSIKAIVDHEAPMDEMPLTPPDCYNSRSPTLSPQVNYISSIEERRNSIQLPMSAEERRYRNKLASAKYRAKKVSFQIYGLAMNKWTK